MTTLVRVTFFDLINTFTQSPRRAGIHAPLAIHAIFTVENWISANKGSVSHDRAESDLGAILGGKEEVVLPNLPHAAKGADFFQTHLVVRDHCGLEIPSSKECNDTVTHCFQDLVCELVSLAAPGRLGPRV